MIRTSMLAAVLASIVLSLVGSSQAAIGSLDPSFGPGGTVTTSVRDGGGVRAMALQPDGKIVVAGFA
jgi:hypothetical protein